MLLKWHTSFNFVIYFTLLSLVGFIISNNSIDLVLFKFDSLIWFICFCLITLGFRSIKEELFPLFNFRPLRKLTTYLFILFGFLVPYLFLKFLINYEILIDHRFIVLYKNGLLDSNGMDLYGLINIMVFVPIWEETFFRGILLIFLSKFLKPHWAIITSAIVFALFHPMYLVVTLISGLILAVITFRTKSLIPAILTHAIWNLYVGVFFLYF